MDIGHSLHGLFIPQNSEVPFLLVTVGDWMDKRKASRTDTNGSGPTVCFRQRAAENSKISTRARCHSRGCAKGRNSQPSASIFASGLQNVCGHSRFKQRLLLATGQMQPDPLVSRTTTTAGVRHTMSHP